MAVPARCWATCVVVALVATGCTQDAPSTTGTASATSTTTSTTTPTTTTPTTSTSTSSTSTTSTSPASTPSTAPTPAGRPAYPDSQQEYTSILVRAWGAGDRTRAGLYATQPAVRELFGAIDPGGPGWALVGCDNAGPRPACTFTDRGQGQRLVLFYDSAKLGQRRAVLDVDFIADDPTLSTQ